MVNQWCLLLDTGCPRALMPRLCPRAYIVPSLHPTLELRFHLVFKLEDSDLQLHLNYGRRARLLPFYTLVCQATE